MLEDPGNEIKFFDSEINEVYSLVNENVTFLDLFVEGNTLTTPLISDLKISDNQFIYKERKLEALQGFYNNTPRSF